MTIKLNFWAFWIFLLTLVSTGAHTVCADDWPLPVRVFFIPSSSMQPTLEIGDRLLVDMQVYDSRAPQNGEIAIFKAPAAALVSVAPGADVDFVKRVVGVPGDVVKIVDRQLFRNGVAVREPFTQWKEENGALKSEIARYSYDMKIVGGLIYSRDYSNPDERGPWTRNNVVVGEKEQQVISSAKPESVPSNQFLMLGDHRNNSNDSHFWGFAPRASFEGRALFVFWPLTHLKMLP